MSSYLIMGSFLDDGQIIPRSATKPFENDIVEEHVAKGHGCYHQLEDKSHKSSLVEANVVDQDS